MLCRFPSSYLADIDNIKNNVPENEKEDAWQKADWYLAEKLLRVIEDFGKAPKAPTKQDLQSALEDDKGDEDEEREPQQKGKKKKPMVTKEILQQIFGDSSDFLDLLANFDVDNSFDRTKLFGDTKINPVSATAKIPSSAKKSPDNSRDKVQPVESSQSQIDSNDDINDIIHQIIERVAPNGAKAINTVRDSYTPQIIAIIINPDGTVKTETTTSGEAPANSSSSQEKNNPVINDAIKDFIQKTTKD